MKYIPLLVLLAVAAGCSGGSAGSNTLPSGGSGTTSTQTQSQAITAMNALGAPVKDVADYNNAVAMSSTSQSRSAQSYTLGTCDNGFEFFSPDKNGDANSTEAEYFYDSGCTELARDTVRIYSISGSSESVNVTESQYALGNATAIAQRSSTVNIIDGTYGQYGYPVVADGFDRSAASQLNLAGTKSIVDDQELVMLAGSGGTNQFCSDSAGYNATGFPSLNETFGWEGGVTSGTRTVNGNGSVTWQATHAGSVYKGAIGSLSIDTGSPNTQCPITTPEYSLSGGSQASSYTIPVTATFVQGWLTDLTVTNAVLANGDTLNVTTNTSLQPTNADFISGTVTNGSTQIATFNVDTFGDGTLTITSSGAQYPIDDWHVVK